MFPSIEPSEVGGTGLAWLFLSYGFLLYQASNLISEGSDLLLLVPSLAGLVGGVVLPLLGAVPDGAIMLFSGLGDIENAQETLSVGVGALAGSTIMLLTIPFGLSVFAGRVDLLEPDKRPNYTGNPKLQPNAPISHTLTHTGVAITEEVQHGAVIMMLTTIPYFLIQGPALFLHGPTEEVAEGEKYWAVAGFAVCVIGFVSYLYLQLQISKKGLDRMKRVAVMKKLLNKGQVSLSGALRDELDKEEKLSRANVLPSDYQSVDETGNGPFDESLMFPPENVKQTLREVFREAFYKYDRNHDGTLDKKEVKIFFRDFHENISDSDMDDLFNRYDRNKDGTISFDEFIGLCYVFIKTHDEFGREPAQPITAHSELVTAMFGEDEEAETVPSDISKLSPKQQQTAIKKRAFFMLTIGTVLVVIFSDPMVDVMQEIAVRLNLSPFYVSFILAPLASNASEVIASQYYAAKKTRKTIAVALTALEGAASMNNTFCLSIFMGLIYFRGLAWQYTAETLAILVVEFIIGFMARRSRMTTLLACIILSVFPLSIAFVAILEALGFD